MKFRLQRVARSEFGVFGALLVERSNVWLALAVTLERSDARLMPVIPAGRYQLKSTKFFRGGYETYEVTPVPGHSRLLLHMGNRERDTEGCVLVASAFEETWVSGSRAAFERFKSIAFGSDTHDIEVRDESPDQGEDPS